MENSPEGLGSPTPGCESKGLYRAPLTLSWSKLARIEGEGGPTDSLASPSQTRRRRRDDRYPPSPCLPLIGGADQSSPRGPGHWTNPAAGRGGSQAVSQVAFSSRFRPKIVLSSGPACPAPGGPWGQGTAGIPPGGRWRLYTLPLPQDGDGLEKCLFFSYRCRNSIFSQRHYFCSCLKFVYFPYCRAYTKSKTNVKVQVFSSCV